MLKTCKMFMYIYVVRLTRNLLIVFCDNCPLKLSRKTFNLTKDQSSGDCKVVPVSALIYMWCINIHNEPSVCAAQMFQNKKQTKTVV